MKISFGNFLNCLNFVLEEVAIVCRNKNMGKNYHAFHQLNCVEYKYNRKGTETNRSWISKASFFFLQKTFSVFIIKFQQNKDIGYFIQTEFDAVSKNFCAPYRNYL